MILVSAVLLLVALGLLVGGLAQGSAALQWGSFAASALAALVLAGGELRRRRMVAAPVGTASPDPASVPAPAAGGPPAQGNGPATGPARMTAPAPATGAPVTTGPAPAAGSTGPLGSLVRSPAGTSAPAAPTPPAGAPVAEEVRAGPAGAALATGPATDARNAPPSTGPTTGAHARLRVTGARSGPQPAVPALGPDGEPPVEEVEVTDLLLVLDLTDEVLVVDEHPRYHLAGCPHVAGVETMTVPMDEARTDGFTPCATCAPDRNLAERERARRA